MAELGNFSLALAWILAVFGIVSGIIAGYQNNIRWLQSCRNATISITVLTLTALVTLGVSFYNNDYSILYVWQYSNRAMDSIYKVSAIWGGMDGSMLLWCAMHTVSAGILALGALRHNTKLMGFTLAVLNGSIAFFITVVLFYTNPFRYFSQGFIPPDGNGLNPLLQNPYMAIHPPSLYAGFTTLAIPYAYCMGALLSGNLSSDWIRLTRIWTLIGWGFLTVGIILGGHWAYLELGWGGFWAWDPVENASFLPWLSATAFLHSVMVQQRREMLKVWNVWLVVLTYSLTVFGTFLTRSGVVQSVHAFAATDVGEVFLQYLAALILLALVLTWYRRIELKSAKHIESILSREAIFLLNNLVLLSIAFATLWGVLFPIFSEWVTGTKQTVGIPFFNAVNVPLFLLLILLMGIGPLVAWRRSSLRMLLRTFLVPFIISLLLASLLLWAGAYAFYPTLSYGLCFFVLLTILQEISRGYRAMRGITGTQQRTPVNATTTLFRRHRIRYGGYLVHFGVLVATIGITASMAHKIEREFVLSIGEGIDVGRYHLELTSIDFNSNTNYEYISARVIASAQGKPYTELTPESRYYLTTKERTSEVALKMSLRDDLYLVLAGLEDDGSRASFKVFINPLQVWLWIGGIIIILGTIVVAIPTRRYSEFTSQSASVAEQIS